MKVPFTPKTVKIVRVMIAMVAVSLVGYAVYAAAILPVNNSATVTIATVPNLFLAPGQTSTTVCSSATTGYSESPTISWGSNVPQLSTQDQYACLENTGQTHTLVVNTTFPANDGTLNVYNGGTGTTLLAGASIPSNSFILVHLNWIVSSTAPLGTTNFNVNIS